MLVCHRNMTPWQMRELLSELRKGRHSYVWLDALSIPAAVLGLEGKPGTWLQEVSDSLVVRMMAVYAAASETLVLKSLEEEGGRYHQRGWTLQEYCGARSLVERVELAPDDAAAAQAGQQASLAINGQSLRSGSASMMTREGEMFRTLRADAMQRMEHAVPLWLQQLAGAEDTDSTLVAGALRYAAVQSEVNTGVPADKVRALVPLLFNSPVQGDDELKDLVMRSMDALNAMATPNGEAVSAMQESCRLIECEFMPPAAWPNGTAQLQVGSMQGSASGFGCVSHRVPSSMRSVGLINLSSSTRSVGLVNLDYNNPWHPSNG